MEKIAHSYNESIQLSNNYLEKIAYIDTLKDQYGKTYKFINRSTKPIGVLLFEKIAIKLYHMIRENESLPEYLVDNIESFIEKEIENGNIETKQGVGFAILSQGFLSINIWGRGNVLFTQTYTIEAKAPHLSREPLEKTGVACTWEIRIMNYEYNLWHNYLNSPMGNKDKNEYLANFISGNL